MSRRDSTRPGRRTLTRGVAIVVVTAVLTLALAVMAGRAVGLPPSRFGFLAALFGGATLVLSLTASSGSPGDSSGSIVLLEVLRGSSASGPDDRSQVVHASLLVMLGVTVGGFAAILLPA